MPFTTGTVSTFTNKLISNEVVDTGDGSTTVFSGTVANPNNFIEGAELTFTIGATTFGPISSDSSGNWTDANLNSGSINASGAWNLDFVTAPDNLTNIEISYTTKGLAQEITDYICSGTQYDDETVGTGDGIATAFGPYNPVGSAMAKGQIRLRFRIAGVWYWAFDNGAGEFEHDEIASSSITYTGTPAVSVTFENPIKTLLL